MTEARSEAADAGVAALELLADQAVGDAVEAGASIALDRGSQQSQGGELRNELAREAMFLKALLDDGQDLLVHQPCNRILHHALFFTECAANVEQIQGVHFAPPK